MGILSNKYNQFRQALPKVLANELINVIADNFQTQSYSGQKWQKRKNNTRKRDKGRALLVDTGRMKNSFRIVTQTPNLIKIATDVTYAGFHNDGTDKLPRRRFLGINQATNKRLTGVVIRLFDSLK